MFVGRSCSIKRPFTEDPPRLVTGYLYFVTKFGENIISHRCAIVAAPCTCLVCPPGEMSDVQEVSKRTKHNTMVRSAESNWAEILVH